MTPPIEMRLIELIVYLLIAYLAGLFTGLGLFIFNQLSIERREEP